MSHNRFNDLQTGPLLVKRWLLIYVSVLAALWVAALIGISVRARVLHIPATLNSLFLVDRRQSYGDFLEFNPKTQRFNPFPDTPSLSYPAPAMCVYFGFTRLFAPALPWFLSLVLLSALIAAASLAISLVRRSARNVLPTIAILLTFFLSYPLMCVLERANIEGVLWPVEMLGVFAFIKKRYFAAALFVALAASMKIYPGILFLLFLSAKRYKPLAVGILAVVCFSVVGLSIVGPTIPQAFAETKAGVMSDTHSMFYRPVDTWLDHSLFGALKTGVAFSIRDDSRASRLIRKLAIPYAAAVITAFASLYWFRLKHLPLLNQLIAFILVSITLPFYSYEYTLLHAYTCWGCLLLFLAKDVAAGRVSVSSSAITIILIGFAILFTPEGFLRGHQVGFGGQLKAVCLLLLISLISLVPLQSSLFNDFEDKPSLI